MDFVFKENRVKESRLVCEPNTYNLAAKFWQPETSAVQSEGPCIDILRE